MLAHLAAKSTSGKGVYRASIFSGNSRFVYVGKATNIGKRIKQHLSKLMCGRHGITQDRFQWAFDKFGGEMALYWDVLERVKGTEDYLSDREQWWLNNQLAAYGRPHILNQSLDTRCSLRLT